MAIGVARIINGGMPIWLNNVLAANAVNGNVMA